MLPLQLKVYHDVGDHNDNEGEKEDSTVEDGVVEINPLDWGQPSEVENGCVSNFHWAGEIIKELESGTLIKVLVRMF